MQKGENKIPIAEEFAKSKGLLKSSILSIKGEYSNYDAMIEFAKLHVEAALKNAGDKYINAETHESDNSEYLKEVIINAYPLTNII